MRDDMAHTTLAAIRDFLVSQGAGVAPWSTHAAAIDHLFDLLGSRRRDERFWIALESLVRRLDDPHFTPRTAGGAAILGAGQVQSIVARLRAELPIRANGASRSRLADWLGSTATAPAILAFLLLGSAIGCAESSCAEEAANHGIEGEQASVYCELVGLINDADIPWNIKLNLLDCLPDLDAEERAWLLDAFGWASEDELAAILEDVSTSWTCDDDWDLDVDYGGH